MSRLPIVPPDWTNSDSKSLKREAHRSYDLPSCETPSQRGRRTPPATVPIRSDMSIGKESKSIARAQLLSCTTSGFDVGNRLPGVRELLLPITFANSDLFTSSARHLSEQPRRFSSITVSPSSESHLSPQVVPSESIRSPFSEPHQFIFPPSHPFESSSPDVAAAMNSEQNPFVQGSPQTSLRTSPFPKVRLSPRSSQYSVSQTNQSSRVSPRIIINNQYWASGTDSRQQDESYKLEKSPHGPLRPSIRHHTQNHVDWGRTKAGKPRKRLAQACLSCRQKKIRCHPNLTTGRCLQCEKSGSDCKFESG